MAEGRRFDQYLVSPDGRWIVGGSRDASGTRIPEARYLLDVSKGSYDALPMPPHDRVLAWLPDSRRFLLLHRRQQLLHRLWRSGEVFEPLRLEPSSTAVPSAA